MSVCVCVCARVCVCVCASVYRAPWESWWVSKRSDYSCHTDTRNVILVYLKLGMPSLFCLKLGSL